MRHFHQRVSAVVLVTTVAAVAVSAHADDGESSSGRWRLELQGMKAFTEDHSDRNGPAYYAASAEYEWPMLKRCTLGLRLYPLFVYPGHDSTNYGAGAGVAGRIYQNADVRDGLFVEGGVSALVTGQEFERDNSKLNFLSELGVGYQFPRNNWHIAVKLEHISNAGLGPDNRGINAVGLGLGYTF
ncbi:MAG: acyloxyacyl hydrolase [Candidatus Hydrogenedentes bacterium]|nr:acyloxyacyl hydrolase [Candidatus Hydrogenedentota bacterium]